MPVPAVLGIPALATFLGGIFTKLVEGFGTFFTRRLAIVLAAITALVALTTAFMTLLSGMVSLLIPAFPPWLSGGLGHILPSSWPLIVSTVISAQVARWVYEWNVKVVQLRLF